MDNRAIRSFTPQISDACIADLRMRLKTTRFLNLTHSISPLQMLPKPQSLEHGHSQSL